MLLSIVIPCYNEEESLRLLYDEMCRVAESMKPYPCKEAYTK